MQALSRHTKYLIFSCNLVTKCTITNVLFVITQQLGMIFAIQVLNEVQVLHNGMSFRSEVFIFALHIVSTLHNKPLGTCRKNIKVLGKEKHLKICIHTSRMRFTVCICEHFIITQLVFVTLSSEFIRWHKRLESKHYHMTSTWLPPHGAIQQWTQTNNCNNGYTTWIHKE